MLTENLTILSNMTSGGTWKSKTKYWKEKWTVSRIMSHKEQRLTFVSTMIAMKFNNSAVEFLHCQDRKHGQKISLPVQPNPCYCWLQKLKGSTTILTSSTAASTQPSPTVWSLCEGAFSGLLLLQAGLGGTMFSNIFL